MPNQLDIKLCTKGNCCPTFQADFSTGIIAIINDDRQTIRLTIAEYELSWQKYCQAKSEYSSHEA
jgi:hypothetical protein